MAARARNDPLRVLGLRNVAGLDYAALSRKLVGPSEWLGTRYYIGQVRQVGNTQLYADQRRFLASLRASDRRISCHLGRIEPRTVKDQTAAELLQYLNHLSARLDPDVFHDLLAIARRHQRATVMVEKAVDVMLAVDMVVMAERDEFDAAYLLSADGDFTHAVGAVRSAGKRVFAAGVGCHRLHPAGPGVVQGLLQDLSPLLSVRRPLGQDTLGHRRVKSLPSPRTQRTPPAVGCTCLGLRLASRGCRG